MLIAYVDESYDQEFFYIGAALATPAQWERIAVELDTVREQTAELHGTPRNAELHGHELMGGKGCWKPLRGKHREAAGIYVRALTIARQHGVRYIFRGLDVRRLNSRYKYPHPPYTVVLSHLLERINEQTCREGHKEPTLVVADQITDEAVQQAKYLSYREDGTPGYRSSKLDKLDAPISFCDSSATDGLQIADLAIYAHRRRERTPLQDPRAVKTLRRICNQIDPSTRYAGTWQP